MIQNIDDAFIDKLNIRLEDINSTRIRIDTGTRCNESCSYCYYRDSLDAPHLDKKIIYKQIDKAKEFGFTEIEFSGGESSIHPNFLDFIKYGTKLGLRCSTLSNGTMERDLLIKANKAGLKEIMYSIHGFKDTHDKITGLSGSYDLIQKQLRTCYKLDMVSRVNIIVNKKSIFELDEIIKELHTQEEMYDIYITQYNFLPINKWEDAEKVSRSHINIINENISKLEEVIDFLEEKEKDLNVRYLEYCKIKHKYHKYIVNHLGHYYDLWDWNPLFINKEDILNRDEYHHDLNLIQEIKENLKRQRRSQYFKDKDCVSCEFTKICDGFKKEY